MGAATEKGTEYWECSVFDSGSGITYEVRANIFKSFYTTRPKSEGTGLGLSIVRSILHDYNGDIRVESTAEAGTTVHVGLAKEEIAE